MDREGTWSISSRQDAHFNRVLKNWPKNKWIKVLHWIYCNKLWFIQLRHQICKRLAHLPRGLYERWPVNWLLWWWVGLWWWVWSHEWLWAELQWSSAPSLQPLSQATLWSMVGFWDHRGIKEMCIDDELRHGWFWTWMHTLLGSAVSGFNHSVFQTEILWHTFHYYSFKIEVWPW